MNRCLLTSLFAAPLLSASFLCAAQPAAPTSAPLAPAGQRNFPATAQYGMLRIAQMPQAQLNGQTVQTAPGFRLLNSGNQLIFAHTVQGQPLAVAYVKEASTQALLIAWILSAEERKRLPLSR